MENKSIEKQQSKVEKEVLDRMLFLLEETKKAATEAFIHNNDRIIVAKELELIRYCSEVENMENLSAEQIRSVKKIQQDGFRKIRGVD